MKKLKFLIVTTLACAVTTHGQNIVQNGDFSSGNSSFASGYSYIPYDYADYTNTPAVNYGGYTVGPYVPPTYPDWAPFYTVSGGNTQMLVANGSETASVSFWEQNVAVVPGMTYNISFYLAEISTPYQPNGLAVADVAVDLNGGQIGDAIAPSVIDTWQSFSFVWNSGSNANALLSLTDLNTVGTGNDFAIDNISMTQAPCFATATATVTNGFVVGANITDPGCDFTNAPLVLIQGGGGSGATAIAVVTNGMITGIIVTDAGSNYTGAPTVVIGEPPSITVPPQSVTVNAYDTASFSVTATGTALMNYQWSLNGTNVFGATTNTLTISNVVQTNLGTYSIVVSNPFGTNSTSASLSMYPYLATPFTGLETYWGQTNTLSVGAWGTGPFSYQWYQDGVAVPDAANQTLTLTAIQFTNAGLYSVVVSSALGSVTNVPYQVIVNPANVALQLCPNVVIQGTVGYNYVIQSTTNLADTSSWATQTNITLAQPIQYWDDTNTDVNQPGNPQKFYRVLPGQ